MTVYNLKESVNDTADGTGSSGELFLTVDASNYFLLTDFEDGFELAAEIDGGYYCASAAGADTILLSKDDGVVIEGDSGYTFTAAISTDLDSCEQIRITGSTSGTVQLENTESGVTLTAENECADVVVETYQGADYAYNTVDDSVVGVVVSDDTDGDTLIETITVADLTTTCTLTLSTTTYTYDGTAKTPAVTVKDAEGNTLTEGVDYTVSYSDNTAVGIATVTVTGIGSYTGTATATFTIEEAAQEPSGDTGDTSGDTSGDTGDTSGDQSGSDEETVPAATKITSAINRAKGIKLTWNAVDGATSYQVYRKVGNGSWKKVKTTTATSWTDTSATKNGTKYQYKVYAVNDSGKSSASATKTIYRLTAKHFTRAKNVKGKKISLKWTRNTRATGYVIQYSTSKSFTSSTTKTVKIKGNKNLTTTLKNLKKGKTYYIRMRAYKTSGSVTSYAGWSKVKKVKVRK
ncbi:MAG: fibronectin type III domain-containing protein [Clostridiales bacterium]|nr:fibronectin type III domain-containing protein [Clostridiales bacterium]